MNYLIDRQNMHLIRKHANPRVLSQLADIECGHVPCSISDFADPRELATRFTDFELKRLYKSITGEDLKSYFIDGIVKAVKTVLDSVTPDDINPILVHQQSVYAWAHSEDEDGETIHYRYKPASVQPERVLEFKYPTKKMGFPLNMAEVAALPTTITTRAARTPSAQAPASPASVVAQPKPAPKATGERHAGTRGAASTVFTVADEMWEKAGKPRDVAVVLALRRTIMTELETNYAIKRTTSSTALGSWQKERLA